MALIDCKECGHKIARSAKTCPSCGAKNKARTSPVTMGCGCLLLALIVGLVVSTMRDDTGPAGPGWEVRGRQGAVNFVYIDPAQWKEQDTYRLAIAKICAGKDFCSVMFWKDPNAIPSRLPMTEPQLDAMVANWSQNSHTGHRELLWSCEIVNDPAQCFSNSGQDADTEALEANRQDASTEAEEAASTEAEEANRQDADAEVLEANRQSLDEQLAARREAVAARRQKVMEVIKSRAKPVCTRILTGIGFDPARVELQEYQEIRDGVAVVFRYDAHLAACGLRASGVFDVKVSQESTAPFVLVGEGRAPDEWWLLDDETLAARLRLSRVSDPRQALREWLQEYARQSGGLVRAILEFEAATGSTGAAAWPLKDICQTLANELQDPKLAVLTARLPDPDVRSRFEEILAAYLGAARACISDSRLEMREEIIRGKRAWSFLEESLGKLGLSRRVFMPEPASG